MTYNFCEMYLNKSIRLKGFDYSSSAAYFVTICTRNRECILGEIIDGIMNLNEMGKIAYKVWDGIQSHFKKVELGCYVIMPNHVHGVIKILDEDSVGRRYICDLQEGINLKYQKLPVIISNYKAEVTRQIHKKYPESKFRWQPSYHDRIIRSERELANIQRYVVYNPVKWDEDPENGNYLNGLTEKERGKLIDRIYGEIFEK